MVGSAASLACAGSSGAGNDCSFKGITSRIRPRRLSLRTLLSRLSPSIFVDVKIIADEMRWRRKMLMRDYTAREKLKITAGAVAALVIAGWAVVLAIAFLSPR